MKIVHFCAGLEGDNGMANTARQFVAEELAAGNDSRLTDDPKVIAEGVDRVCLHGGWLPVLWKAAKKAKNVGAELVIRPAGSYSPVCLKYHGMKKLIVGPWERAKLRRADVVLAACEQERKWILAYEPRVKKVEVSDLKRFFKFKVLGSGFQVPGSTSQVSGLTSLNGGEPRSRHVLYLGRRHPLKGVEFLERAVEEVNAAIGQSNDPDSRMITLRIVSDHFGEELEKDWEWCDVLCLPTLSENFGRVVAEALERGKCVITTDGAPAWGEEAYGGRLTYLTGFLDGSDEERVKLLKGALLNFCQRSSLAGS